MIRALALCGALAGPAAAESVFAARSIPANTVVLPGDIMLRDVEVSGAAVDPRDIIGKETRIALYMGRPIRPSDVGPPSVVRRNEIVDIRYKVGGLSILSAGRALDQGAVGDRVRVMNLDS
ncbi:MAG: flagellar basal body P-ring formation chaperone FlgA, partial [Pseudomonadota bacterium]